MHWLFGACPDAGPTTGSTLTSATASLDVQVTVPVAADDTATLLDTMALAVMALQVREGSVLGVVVATLLHRVMLRGHCGLCGHCVVRCPGDRVLLAGVWAWSVHGRQCRSRL